RYGAYSGRDVAGRRLTPALVAATALLVPAPASAASGSLDSADAYARYDGSHVVLGNGFVERDWSRSQLRTTKLLDKRRGRRRWSTNSRDFVLRLGNVDVGSESFRVASVALARIARGGVRVTMRLTGSGSA